MALVYKSKIDVWMSLVLLFVVAISTLGCWWAVEEGGWKMVLTLVSAGGFGIVMPVWVFLATKYTLDHRNLGIQSGPFRWEVPITQITSISETSNPLSSPALSMDRLKIEHADGSVMISPENKEEFLRRLESYRELRDRSR